MIDNVLTLNAGSSSLKFAVFGATSGEHVRGKVEGFGSMPRFMVGRRGERKQEEIPWKDSAHPATVEETLDSVLAWLRQSLPEVSIDAVGHRIVHGGPNRSEPVLLDNDVLADLGKLVALAPLHQPHNLAGVEAVRSVLGELPQVACFDSAFHRRHPWVNDVFGLPLKLYEEGVRRYGFHGISYEYVHKELHRIAPLIAAGRVVVAHLGNGASMCAMLDGRSVGSTMGFTALDGLPMGTRCGQLDPGVLLYLLQERGMQIDELADMLYHRSGLLGLSGVSQDMRDLQASTRPEAAQALDYFVFRIQRELGGLAAVLRGIDALVFTGGIGENSTEIRERVCLGNEWLGIELDLHRNRSGEPEISTSSSHCRVLVIPTDEEITIAGHTRRLVDGR